VTEVDDELEACMMKLVELKHEGGSHMADFVKLYDKETGMLGDVKLQGQHTDLDFKIDTQLHNLVDGAIK
jgi:hypothetical protein